MMHDPDVFYDILSKSTAKFAEISADVLRNVFAAQCRIEKSEIVADDLGSKHDFFVSILFTGNVYGEYIMGMSEKTAAAIAGNAARNEIGDSFGEVLNLIVGETVVGLNQIYRKLTITPPKVHFGNVRYPKVTIGRSRLNTAHGPIDCYLFVDRAKLDIASSYQEALGSMMVAHKDLQGAVDKLQSQQTQLMQSEKMAALGAMAAGIAHEINTPLQIVSLVSNQVKDLLTKDDQKIDRPALNKYLETVDSTVERIGRISNSMRFFANESKRQGFHPHKLSQVMENVLFICETKLGSRGISLRYTPPPADFIIECRAAEISQLLLSLIDNACDAVEGSAEKWIQIECSDAGPSIDLRVSDSGPGVPKDLREKIFDPYFTTKDSTRGTGLGLSLAASVAVQHMGEIKVDSKTSQSCFHVRLPKKQIPAAA